MVLYTSGPSVGTEPYIEETDEDFRVSPRIFTDPAIFEEEMERIFGRAWVYVGHVSEIAQAGDYKTSSIGRTPIILSRDQHGQIHVLVNACRHRANAVCRSDAGNSTYFRCPYHGWVYANDGRLIGVAMRKGYPPSFGEDVDGLVKAARVAVYRGLIFASMAPTGPTIEEYLGPVARHIDAWADQAIEGDLEVVRPHQYNYFGNWKFQAENGADGYHPGFVHESAFKTFSKFAGITYGYRSSAEDSLGYTMGFPNGHGLLGKPLPPGVPMAGLTRLPQELFDPYFRRLTERFGEERARDILSNRHIFIFPNVYLMDVNIRVIQPIAVDRTYVYSHFIRTPLASDEFNEARLADLQRRLGTSGMVGLDDVEMFAANQSGMMAKGLDYVFYSRGLHRERIGPNGECVGMHTDETPQRSLYRGWRTWMADEVT